jgi:polysaccharide export outer membrane protein
MVRHTNVPVVLAVLLLLNACVRTGPVREPPNIDARPVVGSGAQPVVTPLPSTASSAGRSIVPRDLIDVTVFEAPDLGRVVRVSDDGMIALPLIGPIQAAGRTPRALEVALQDTLRRTYMRDPRVLVEVKEVAPQPIYVIGEVNQPGALVPSGQDRLTVLRAIAVARGVKPEAARGRAMVLRPRVQGGDPLQIPVNLDEIARGKAPDFVLLPNDVVYVPKNTERAVALGVVDALIRLVTFRAVF